MSRIIKLSYSCRKDWGTMPLSTNGRHCSSCEKEVIDLSTLGYDDLSNQLAGLGKEACVKIPEAYAEQEVLEGIELTIPQGLKRLVLAASLVGATLALPAQSKEPVKIEAASVLSVDKIKQNQAPSASSKDMQSKASTDIEQPKTPGTNKRKRVLFTSSRFPFIHYRRPHARGYSLGCPSF